MTASVPAGESRHDTPPGVQLVYVGDPMCSWCYGFGQSLEVALQALPHVRLDIVLGGVRAGSAEVLDDAGKRFRLTHWARVEQASSLPFNRGALLARQGFVYDTEPACRAVVLARRYVGDRVLLAIMRRLQHAFYVEGRDITDTDALLSLLEHALRDHAIHVPADELRAQWRSDALRGETAADFAQARRWGVRSFPALLLRAGSEVRMLADGYLPAPALLQRLRAQGDQAEPALQQAHPGVGP